MGYYSTIYFEVNLKPECVARYRDIQQSQTEKRSLIGLTFFTWYSCSDDGYFKGDFKVHKHYDYEVVALVLAPLVLAGDIIFIGRGVLPRGFSFDGEGHVYRITYERTVSNEIVRRGPVK